MLSKKEQAQKCDSFLQIWNYQSLTDSLTNPNPDTFAVMGLADKAVQISGQKPRQMYTQSVGLAAQGSNVSYAGYDE